MNLLWAGMMLIAILYGAFHGTIPEVTQAALDSSKEAVTLCVTMLGILSFWMGLMQIGSACGLITRFTRGIRPVLHWLFPRIPKGHPAMEQIAVNCIANVLGLGWAATPAGLKAMEELENLEEERRAGGWPPLFGSAKRHGKRRDVRVFDPEYLIPAADSHECGSVPEPVWEHKSHGDRGACDYCDRGEYAGGDYFL